MRPGTIDHARRRFLGLGAVIATSFGVGLVFGIGFPLTALTFEHWGQPAWMTGLASAVPALGILLALPLAPIIVARIGIVSAMVLGCSLGALGFLAMYAWQDPWAWIHIRFVMSTGFAIPWVLSETWINSVSSDGMRGRVIAGYTMALFLGIFFGPLALRFLGISGPLPFFAAALTIGVALLPIVFARKLAPPFEHTAGNNLRVATGLAPTAMIGSLLGGMTEITCLSLVANVAMAAGRSQEHSLGLVTTMTLGGILLQLPLGWLADKIRRVLVLLGMAILSAALVLLLPMSLQSPFMSSLLAFALGGASMGYYTVSLAIVGERVPRAELAAANVSFLGIYQIGATIGPIVAGIVMTTVAPIPGFVATIAGLTLLCALAIVRFEFRGSQSR